jgi:D-arabinose 1-dehydrogenase-like Zn-dependent alcohol dehydrogenase
MRNVRTGGMIVVSGATTGDQPGAELRRLFVDQISVRGSYAGTLQEFRSMIEFVTFRKLAPKIDRVLPMSEAREALQRMWEGNIAGKIVLTAG